jgi:nucleosome assembly protein 1-like 1
VRFADSYLAIHRSIYVQYANLAKPLFDRRLEIISGKSLPTPEELTKGHDQELKDKEEFDDSDDEDDEDEDNEEKIQTTLLPHEPIVDGEPGAEGGIPQFWLTTLRNHSGLSELITERDEKALEHLTDVRFEHLDPNAGEKKMGFKLIFCFNQNPYFEQTVLEKTYHYQVCSRI